MIQSLHYKLQRQNRCQQRDQQKMLKSACFRIDLAARVPSRLHFSSQSFFFYLRPPTDYRWDKTTKEIADFVFLQIMPNLLFCAIMPYLPCADISYTWIATNNLLLLIFIQIHNKMVLEICGVSFIYYVLCMYMNSIALTWIGKSHRDWS